MNKEDFYKGFNLIEKNFVTMDLDLKMKIRDTMRDLPAEVWQKICDELLKREFKFPAHPIFKDFMDLKREYTRVVEEKKCLRCEGENTTAGNFCGKCEAFLKSPEGLEAREQTREWFREMAKKLEGIGKGGVRGYLKLPLDTSGESI